jgi:4-hydroxy-tetrahydrodipicolinate synthase
MYALDDDERIALASHTVRRVDGRVPVVASGSFGDSTAGHAAGIRRMAETGVTAVVVLTNALVAQEADDGAWIAQAEQLLEATGTTPLGLYECPQPYHRLLGGDSVAWAAATHRFLFIKETSGQLAQIADKIGKIANSPLRLFNADAATLLASLRLGADGFCGVSANFFPDLWVWLCRNANDDPETAERLHQFLREAEHIIVRRYPASAKYYLGLCGLPLTPVCRSMDVELNPGVVAALAALRDEAWQWHCELARR